MLKLPPLALYIHFPWCLKKCPYCDFNSHTLKNTLPETGYINTLLTDFKSELNTIDGRSLNSIYMGGGTPSLFSAQSINDLLKKINSLCSFNKNIEITIEANPGSLTFNQLMGYRQAGVNRLSMGVQSFNNGALKKLGRIHNRETAQTAIQLAQQAGFNNFNVDLMHGLPQQTVEEGLDDLRELIKYNPSHLSWYQLTIEPHTQFFHQPPHLPEESIITALNEKGAAMLNEYGFKQYEISAFSRLGLESKHNMNYWHFGDYIGIGAGAHGKITYRKKQLIQRYSKIAHPKTYLDKPSHFYCKVENLDSKTLPFEFMLNALRCYQKIDRQLFESRTGLTFESLMPTLQYGASKALLKWDQTGMELTSLGRRFYNDAVGLFL